MDKEELFVDSEGDYFISFQNLSVCSIIYNEKSELLNINRVAREVLCINSIEDLEKYDIIDKGVVERIINSLEKENYLESKKLLSLKKVDNTKFFVELSVCKLKSKKTFYYLFQFFEIKPSVSRDKLKVASNALYKDLQKLKPYLNKYGVELLNSVNTNYFFEEKNKSHLYHEFLDDNILTYLSAKFSFFSENEKIVLGLLMLGMSVKDISLITEKTTNNIRVTIFRMLKKNNLSSKKELIQLAQNIKK